MWVLGHRRDTFDHARPCAVFVVDGHGDKSRDDDDHQRDHEIGNRTSEVAPEQNPVAFFD